jgi:hypothetical protein
MDNLHTQGSFTRNLEFVFPGKLRGVVFTRNAVVQVACFSLRT